MIKDFIDLQASIYGFCGIESLYQSLGDILASKQGLSQFSGRLSTAMLTVIPAEWPYISDPALNTFCRAYHSAKVFSDIFMYQIQ
jgi:hypothetical protein